MAATSHALPHPMTTRFDPPHVQTAAAQPYVELSRNRESLLALAGHGDAERSGQMDRQAAEISDRLMLQERDLHQREAEFNARAARMENELRTARLLYREREMALQEKQEEFTLRLNQLRQQNIELVAAQSAVEQESTVDHASRRAGLDEVRTSVEQWQKKLRGLEESERRLKSHLADAASKQRHLDQQSTQLATSQREQTSRLEADQVAFRQRYDDQLRKVNQRGDELEQRKLLVQQLHSDVSRMYREAIEIRLCTEEMWGQLQHHESPTELATRLAESRRKLNDQYSLAKATLTSEKEEISALLKRLETHESRLTQQRDELRGWVSRRQAEIEDYAGQLLQRERELDLQDSNLQQTRHAWHETRENLEQEIRRLQRLESVDIHGRP